MPLESWESFPSYGRVRATVKKKKEIGMLGCLSQEARSDVDAVLHPPLHLLLPPPAQEHVEKKEKKSKMSWTHQTALQRHSK